MLLQHRGHPVSEYRSHLRCIVTLFLAVGIAGSVSGCGRTLVFAEREGVNFAVRASSTSASPVEVNFGLDRVIATIVPPAGDKNGKPDGDAVSMFAGFQIDNTLDVKKPLNANMQIDTQFASGNAAIAVASKPQVVAQIVNARTLTYSASESSKKLSLWLNPDGKFSTNRSIKLQDWLDRRYSTRRDTPKRVFSAEFLDDGDDDYEAGRKAALSDTVLMATPRG